MLPASAAALLSENIGLVNALDGWFEFVIKLGSYDGARGYFVRYQLELG